ncbi:glutathione S-transferase family protein [Aerosticca soli]|uniref:Glutathione S-transferase n=1 Tax=Aerosticca soli TaxID=2010829 RepID=A0A2Z6E8L6_9GAMM|nr:glutathione S-transferase family protein [Aerosticca soli]BBD81172.1 glutathione S-transferase [Aerosticca soli]
MIRLYHCENARSFRPLWALEELDLDYELVMLPFPPRAHARDYLAINPLGTVPAFFDGDTAMTESAAICQYLACRYGDGRLDVGADAPDYGAYLNALHFGEATLTFPLALILRYGRLEAEPRRQPQVVEDYRRWFHGRLRAIESRLAQRPHLCGERFTAADIVVGYALHLAGLLGLGTDFLPMTAAYAQRLAARPAFQRALARQRTAAAAAGLEPFP